MGSVTHIVIPRDGGRGYIQRTGQHSGSDDPMTEQELLIIELYNKWFKAINPPTKEDLRSWLKQHFEHHYPEALEMDEEEMDVLQTILGCSLRYFMEDRNK